MTAQPEGPVLSARSLTKRFKSGKGKEITALDAVSIDIPRSAVTGLLGPDGAGKTTLIRIATGLLVPDSGSIRVLGIDLAAHPGEVQSRAGYMPQKFGLYEDLTVQENLDLYADLHGIPKEERSKRYPELMHMTGLGRFTDRLAGRLSGGMKQKLGLACTLVRSPDILFLDEPTVGVDPLSRRELWEIVYRLVKEQGLTVLVSTSYLDEAEKCDTTVVLLQGKVLAQGSPSEISSIAEGRSFRISTPETLKPRQLQARLMEAPGVVDATLEGRLVRFVESDPGELDPALLRGLTVTPVRPRFEDAFMTLVRRTEGKERDPSEARVRLSPDQAAGVSSELVVEVRDLVKRFGAFYAVRDVTFQVRRGEIFGLLGPNGAGKSTTFRMLCGLLQATGGTLSVAGVDLHHARASARQRIGYVAQKFSLYGQLSVLENLDFFSGAYGLRGGNKKERMQWALEQFGLAQYSGSPAGQLPGGFKQRLAMACALMHEPEILFLDEPTSGVDPLARREFWHRIGSLADLGVTVIVTTHFMEEAEYCDRMVIMVDGEILAAGSPAEIRGRARMTEDREPTIEDAFISIVEDYRQERRAA
ncbi:MAG: ATP-binding cassette domain-containing protein [Desulfobacteraceae bacterium]|nr:ATP-binding cassette domain-containing protein [Desulfobacteraceae bacterium]